MSNVPLSANSTSITFCPADAHRSSQAWANKIFSDLVGKNAEEIETYIRKVLDIKVDRTKTGKDARTAFTKLRDCIQADSKPEHTQLKSKVLAAMGDIQRSLDILDRLTAIVQSTTNPTNDRKATVAQLLQLCADQNFIRDFVPHDKTALDVIKTELGRVEAPNSRYATMMKVIEGMERAQGILEHFDQHALVRLYQDGDQDGMISVDNLWRMCIDFDSQDGGCYTFEDEPGYLAGMLNGFQFMLGSMENVLDAEWLEQLHDQCISGVLRDNAIDELGDIPSGYRDGTRNGFRLSTINSTPEGREEINELTQPHALFANYFSEFNDSTIMTPTWTRQQCKVMADRIFSQYRLELYEIPTENRELGDINDDKYSVIARCCRNLEVAHLFRDANARTIGFLLVNRLLLDNGLPPTIMQNPNHFDMFSVAQLVQEIKEGHNRFNELLETTIDESGGTIDEETQVPPDSWLAV